MDGLQATMRIRNPVEDPANASVWNNLRQSVSSPRPSSASVRGTRPVTPSPTIRQMRYALTSVGSGTSSAASNDIAFQILEENRRVPIIAVTANAFLDQQRRHCISVGMNDVVSKPVTPEAIKNIIHRYLDAADQSHMRLSLEALTELVEPRVGVDDENEGAKDVEDRMQRLAVDNGGKPPQRTNVRDSVRLSSINAPRHLPPLQRHSVGASQPPSPAPPSEERPSTLPRRRSQRTSSSLYQDSDRSIGGNAKSIRSVTLDRESAAAQ